MSRKYKKRGDIGYNVTYDDETDKLKFTESKLEAYVKRYS